MKVSVCTLCGLGGCNSSDGTARLCSAKAIVHERGIEVPVLTLCGLGGYNFSDCAAPRLLFSKVWDKLRVYVSCSVQCALLSVE